MTTHIELRHVEGAKFDLYVDGERRKDLTLDIHRDGRLSRVRLGGELLTDCDVVIVQGEPYLWVMVRPEITEALGG